MNIINDIELIKQAQNQSKQDRETKEALDYKVFKKTLYDFYKRLLPLNLGTAIVVRQGWGDCEGAGDLYYTNCVLHVVLEEKKEGFFCHDDSLSIEYRSGWNLFGPVKSIIIDQSFTKEDKLYCQSLDYKTDKSRTWFFEPDELYQLIIEELIRDKFKNCEKK